MIVDWQREPLNDLLIHIDLKRIALDKTLRVSVRVKLLGIPIGVKTAGGILDQVLREVELECLPADIPATLTRTSATLRCMACCASAACPTRTRSSTSIPRMRPWPTWSPFAKKRRRLLRSRQQRLPQRQQRLQQPSRRLPRRAASRKIGQETRGWSQEGRLRRWGEEVSLAEASEYVERRGPFLVVGLGNPGLDYL